MPSISRYRALTRLRGALLALPLLGFGAAGALAADEAVNTVVYYRAGNWEAFSGRAVGAGTFCGYSTYFPRDGRGLQVRFRTGGDQMIFRARKPDWQVPEGTRVAVSMQIGPNDPFLTNATGKGEVLEWTLPRESMATFDAQFRRGAVLTLAFPSGNEPAWAIPLTGSNAIGATFARCMTELAAAAASTQPFQAAAPQAAAPQAAAPEQSGGTQPFSQNPAAQATPSSGTSAPAAPTPDRPAPTQPTQR